MSQKQNNPLWERDDIQFPRLLAEIMATQDKLDMPALAAEMDCTVEDIGELFDRAQERWVQIKQEHCVTVISGL